MRTLVRAERAEPDFGRLDEEIAALVKGMLVRGDKQSDIAACFLLNGGRVSEINTGERFPDVPPAPPTSLPPCGPYSSPYDLWKSQRELWRVRVALEAAEAAIHEAIVTVHKAEQR
jgi:hypothetical protein